jgi:gamma-glutamyltranspeptidase/glutathione hydrolase
MDDFSAAPGQANVYGLIGGEANAIAPGKTPLSSMAPTLVFENGAVRYALGAPGGSRIISSLYMTLLYALDLGDPAYVAVARGRIHHQYAPDLLFAEEAAVPAALREALSGLGHETRAAEIPAKVFLVERKADRLIGVSDPRGDGRPMGE